MAQETFNEQEKIRKYLKRIRYNGKPALNFNTLHALQHAHLITVPYENLDIMRNIPISLEIKDIYEKIVNQGRGGYCFELNGLFAWLLRSLGFNVIEHMARFLRGETEVPMRRHRVMRVSFGHNEYLCDVGVGGVVPRKPIPLITSKVSEQNGERYKLELDDFFGYVLYEWKHDNWRGLYSFTNEEQLNIDYIMPSFYCENHPSSQFRVQDMVHIFTTEGRKSVVGREFRIFSPDNVKIITPTTNSAYKELLYLHFGIVI